MIKWTMSAAVPKPPVPARLATALYETRYVFPSCLPAHAVTAADINQRPIRQPAQEALDLSFLARAPKELIQIINPRVLNSVVDAAA
jgi:hypothetical protein